MFYQLKISIAHINPPVWRRIIVDSESYLSELHDLIQIAFSWEGSHLYQFAANGMRYGDPELLEDDEACDDIEVTLSEVLENINEQLIYTYDFGDDWRHIIELEKITDKQETPFIPYCVAGKRAGPPEDCGGPPGYQHLLNVLKKGTGDEYEEMREWLGDPYDSEEFDIVFVNEQFSELDSIDSLDISDSERNAKIDKLLGLENDEDEEDTEDELDFADDGEMDASLAKIFSLNTPPRLLMRFASAINEHDLEAMEELMTDDHVFLDPNGFMLTGKVNMLEYWKNNFTWFPDYKVEFTDIMDNGNDLAAFGFAGGTFAGGNNEEWKIPSAWRVQIQDGLIKVWQAFADTKVFTEILKKNGVKVK